ncbi:MAG TPA: DUF4169 family protein [Pseudolabrys sp.]|nr:DUF4169 family protein [Pseudolabrys sp.]
MADVVNLRTMRKQAKRKQDETRASANRLAYGQPKDARKLAAAQKDRANRTLDGHRLDKGDGR